MTERIGDWMQTFSGQQFWPLDPRPEEVSILDIAHALSLTCRYNGHCREFYSVGQHSIEVASLVWSESGDDKAALWGLMHDAAEAYVGDMIRPLKRSFPAYCEVEERVMRAIANRFNLPWAPPYLEAIHRADNVMLATEARDLMATPPVSWQLPEPARENMVEPMAAATVERLFLQTFWDLGGRRA